MSAFPLLTHARADDVVAYRHGKSVTAVEFLTDVRALALALPDGRHVLNACGDRYRFAVGLAAALLTGKISLLPPTLAPEMVRQVQHLAPDLFCLTDQPQSLDVPQWDWTDLVTARAAVAVDARTDG